MTETNLLPPPPIPVSKLPFKPLHLVIGLIISLTFVGTIFAAYYYGVSQNAPVVLPSPTSAPQPTVLPTTIPSPVVSIIPTSANNPDDFGKLTWLSSPIKTTNPDVLKKSSDPNFYGYTFDDQLGTYVVGKFSSGAELLLIFIRGEGPGSALVYRLIKHNGQYFLVESVITDNSIKPELPNIFDKNKIKFISYDTLNLLPPSYLLGDNKINFVNALGQFGGPQFFPSITDGKPQKITSSKFGDIYAVYSTPYELKQVLGRELYLKLADSTLDPRKLSLNFFYDNQVPRVTFTGAGDNKDQFSAGIPFRCGLGSANSVIKNGDPLLNDKQEIGNLTGQTDKKIYQIKKADSPLVQLLYKQYSSNYNYPSAAPVISVDEFKDRVNHFLYQDELGDWILFVNTNYALQAECGKPVIYLYPEIDTPVSVRVAANITKSEPLYPQNGWQVLAHPNGLLEYQNKTYPNLFWEGLGQGNYPDRSGEGVVVPQNKLITTLKSQLAQLGLNAQESADFLEFWQPKLPTTSYVRLTWLDTKDMNQLAPLSVSPMPRTIIRIFLEFEGLNKPVALKPQKLSAPPRVGFTLVEWGGLLRK